MGKYDNIIGKPAYRTLETKNDGRIGYIERDYIPFLPPLILRFNDKKGIRCYPKDLIIVNEEGRDLGKANKFLK